MCKNNHGYHVQHKILQRLSALVLVSGILIQCTMIPEYIRPELPVDEEWQIDVGNPIQEKTVAAYTLGWQDVFHSPGLQKVIEIALEHNRDLRVAALQVEAARSLYRIKRADLFPDLNVTAQANRRRTSEAERSEFSFAEGITQEDITSTYSASLATTGFEIDIFGRLRSENAVALNDYFATQHARDAVHIALIGEVANVYLQWLADRKLVTLAEETLITQQKTFDLIEAAVEKGGSSKLELSQIRQAVESAKANKILYQQRVLQDRNALLMLMGTKSISEKLVEEQLDEVKIVQELPVSLPSEILLMRPDIKQAEYQLKAANADIGAARAAFFPRITLTANIGMASRDLNDLFSSASAGAWNFAPQITMPIFNAGRNRAQLDYTVLIKEKAVAEYEKAIQTAFREINDQLAIYTTIKEQLAAQQQLVEATGQSYDLSYARYKQGIDNFLTVLDAQRAQFAAQQQEIEVEKQRLANLVNLYKVLGGGLKTTRSSDASPVEMKTKKEHHPETKQ